MSIEFDSARQTPYSIYYSDVIHTLNELPRFDYLEKGIDFTPVRKIIKRTLDLYGHNDDKGQTGPQADAIRVIRKYDQKLLQLLPATNSTTSYEFRNIYIPMLRGLRPVQLAGHPPGDHFQNMDDNYYHRTVKDYFYGKKINEQNVYTGLNLYRDLQEYSHGEPEKQEQLERFEKFLSETFFSDREVKLTPRIKKDVPYVRIGKRDMPIYDLGDGIQSLIILTYPLFFNQNEVLKVYIEEPETHLHPGYQRAFLETLLKPEFKNFQYFITTHSNHFLDITLDTNNISVYTFEQVKEPSGKECFLITNVDNSDTNILSLIGVKNSSVFLSNCTIWVEGITDRIYLRKLLEIVQAGKTEKFQEDTHFSFVEFGGSNITHWSFLDSDDPNHKNILVDRLCSRLFLITDRDNIEVNDISNKSSKPNKKSTRYKLLQEKLKDRFYCLKCREIENLLGPGVLCSLIKKSEKWETTSPDFCKDLRYEDYQNQPLGAYIDNNIVGLKKKYSAQSGSIANKVDFAKKAVDLISLPDDLSEEALDLASRLYQFIKANN